MLLPATKLRVGMVIVFNDDPCRVIKVQHVTPGKGHAMVQAKMKNISTGLNVEHRFRSMEKFEKVFLEKQKVQYLYSDGSDHVFMNSESYEQISLDDEVLGDGKNYLVPELALEIEMYGENPVGIELPTTVNLEIIDTEPQLKGATASASYKTATLETGLVIQVPPYLSPGQKVKVDTREAKFLSKAD